MSFIDGFVLAVPSANKAGFREMAQRAAQIFIDHGATRVIECWGEDVPDGKKTDFRRAVQAEDGETVVFSWIEWPSREVRDAGNDKVMADPRMQPSEADKAQFDGTRMIFGGFVPIVEARGQ